MEIIEEGELMNCPKCGVVVTTEEARFCPECGYTLAQSAGQAEEAATIQVAAPAPTPAPSVQQAQTPTPAVNNRDSVYGIGGFLGTLLLLLIPIANIILLIVWAVSGTVNRNKKNFAIAYLIIMAIGIVLAVALSASLTAFIATFLSGEFL